MSEHFARPASELYIPRIGTLEVAASPSGGQGLSLDETGGIPEAVRKLLPGYTYGYAEIISNATVTATTEGTANTVITAPTLTFDGSVTISIEFDSPRVENGANFTLLLCDNGTAIGQLAFQNGSVNVPMRRTRALTPTSGEHIYSIRAFVSSGTGTVYAGAGGSGTMFPTSVRVVRV